MPILCKLLFNWNTFPQTPMTLGKYSNIFGIIACIWLFGTSILLFFPQSNPVTSETMNWAVVVVPGFGIIALMYCK